MRKKIIIAVIAIIIVLVGSFIALNKARPDWMFLNMSLEEHITTEAYLVDKSYMRDLFENDKIVQPQLSTLSKNGDDLYFVIRVRNNSGAAIWGTLDLISNLRYPPELAPMSFEVDIPLTMYHQEEFDNYVFPAGGSFRITKEKDNPVIYTKWKWLYAK